jgi:hypothetical protein
MRHSWLWLVLCVSIPVLGFSTLGSASDVSPSVKRPLDLPAGGRPADGDEEEDAPETIMFYGSELEGDCFVWCFPAYGFCGETTVFTAIRAEISAALGQLSNNSDFDLVCYNSTTYVWRPTVCPGNVQNRALATAWMNSMVPTEFHCIVEAATTSLGILQAASSDYKQLILCGAHEPFCNGQGGPDYVAGALLEITGANYEGTPIHTVYFTTTFYNGESAFYQQLANMNSGSFREVAY